MNCINSVPGRWLERKHPTKQATTTVAAPAAAGQDLSESKSSSFNPSTVPNTQKKLSPQDVPNKKVTVSNLSRLVRDPQKLSADPSNDFEHEDDLDLDERGLHDKLPIDDHKTKIIESL